MCVDREQQNGHGHNELEQSQWYELERAIKLLGQCCTNTIPALQEALQELAEQSSVVIKETKEIAILEQRRKHCKNYLELKQINRRLNLLKFKQRRRRS